MARRMMDNPELKNAILNRLVKQNRYSMFIDFGEFYGQDAAVLQAVILCEVGQVVKQETGADTRSIINMFEKTFECRPALSRPARYRQHDGKKVREIDWICIGSTVKDIMDHCDFGKRQPSSHELGPAMRELDKHHLVKRKLVANYWKYVSNGYEYMLENNILKYF